MKQRIVLIGPGRLGAAVGKRLYEAGYHLAAVIGRERHRIADAVDYIGCDPAVATTDQNQARQGDIILLAVPDVRIGAMARQLQMDIGLPDKAVLVHFSGLLPAAEMAVEHSDRILISIHPLLSFADRDMATARLTDCPCAVEGDASGLPLAEQLVTAMGGHAFHLPTDAKALYHAAACIASNFMVTLTASARDLLVQCGFNRQQSMELLTPIHRATSDNLTRLGPEAALTGPIVRGDIETISSHIDALKEKSPQLTNLYRCLGQQTVELATASGRLDKEQSKKLLHLLSAIGS